MLCLTENSFKRYTVEKLKDGKIGKYRKKDVEFTYYTKKQFNQVVSVFEKKQAELEYNAENVLKTVGYLRLKDYKMQDVDDTVTVNGTVVTNAEIIEKQACDTVIFEKEVRGTAHSKIKVVGLETKLLEKQPMFTYVRGYLAVGKQQYVQWCKSWLPIFILLVGLVFCCVAVPVTVTKLIEHNAYIEEDPNYDANQQNWNGKLPKSGKDSFGGEDTTTFPGYNTVIVTQEAPTMELINPAVNTVDFTYSVVDAEGNTLYTTSKIRPGKCVPFSIGKLFATKGAYDLSLVVNTYDVNDGTECTSITVPIILYVE